MTKNRFNRNCLSTITLAALLLAAPIAYAESGTRLCGFSTDMPAGTVLDGNTLKAGGKMGIFYEVNKDNAIREVCDKAINGIKAKIQADATLSSFQWKTHKRDECEWPGVDFVSDANTKTDMCEYMQNHATKDKGYKGYVVVKAYNSATKGAATTNYIKQ
jgi:hypothetical protein